MIPIKATVVFTLFGTTKRTVKYQAPPNEVFGNGLTEVMQWLNPAFLSQPYPKAIKITVEPVVEEVEVANNL